MQSDSLTIQLHNVIGGLTGGDRSSVVSAQSYIVHAVYLWKLRAVGHPL